MPLGYYTNTSRQKNSQKTQHNPKTIQKQTWLMYMEYMKLGWIKHETKSSKETKPVEEKKT